MTILKSLFEGPVKGLAKRALGAELEEVARVEDSLDLAQERLAELELALEDMDWMRIMGEEGTEFSRDGLRKISRLARVMFLKNPLILRGVNVKKSYVWGQGMSWQAADEDIQTVIQDFMDDEKNQVELTSPQARMQKEIDLEVDGNVFLVFFPNVATGRVRVRSIPFEEIEDILCNPQDKKEPWYYRRRWTEVRYDEHGGRVTTDKIAYYPDWRYSPTPANKPVTIGGQPVHWQSPVFHIKVGGFSDWKFGISEVYAAIDWAKAYKEFLEDVATLMRAYSRFAWRMTTKGGKNAIANAKSRLQTTLLSGSGQGETNPPPLVGSTFIGRDGVSMDPVNVRGASVNPEDGRRLLLMAVAAIGLPETFFGDVSVGTLATAKSLDRPTELMMLERQTLWGWAYAAIFDYVVRWALKAPKGKLSAQHGRVDTQVEYNQVEERIQWNEGVDGHIDTDFPPLISDDKMGEVEAIVQAATLGGMQLAGTLDLPTLTRMLLVALGEDDVDQILEQLFPDGVVPDEIDDDRAESAEAKFVEAVRGLMAHVENLREPAANGK